MQKMVLTVLDGLDTIRELIVLGREILSGREFFLLSSSSHLAAVTLGFSSRQRHFQELSSDYRKIEPRLRIFSVDDPTVAPVASLQRSDGKTKRKKIEMKRRFFFRSF